MLSLITQRLVARLPTASFPLARASILFPSTLQAQSQTRLNHRTFLTGSPRLAFPTAAKKPTASASAKKSTASARKKVAATKKPAATAKKTATKAKAKPKKKVVAKKKVATKKKPIVKKKPKKPVKPKHPKLTPADFPPRTPGSAYVFFYSNYVKTLPPESKPHGVAGIVQCSKTAGHLWGAMTDEEKEPWREQERKAKAAFQVQRDAYWKGVDSKTLAEINRRRRVRGKKGIRRITMPEDKRPISSFLRYMAEFRNSPDGQIVGDSVPRGPETMRIMAKTAGLNWRRMSEAEKAKYAEPAAREREAWNLKHSKP